MLRLFLEEMKTKEVFTCDDELMNAEKRQIKINHVSGNAIIHLS